jgi:hypothetical protein
MMENVLAFFATLRSAKDHRLGAIAVGDVLRHAVDVMTLEVEQAGCRIEMNNVASCLLLLPTRSPLNWSFET